MPLRFTGVISAIKLTDVPTSTTFNYTQVMLRNNVVKTLRDSRFLPNDSTRGNRVIFTNSPHI